MTPTSDFDTRRSAGQPTPSRSEHAELTGDLSVVVGSLHRAYDEQVGATAVETEIQQVADGFTGARIRAFVPLLVRRYAGARLRALQREPQADPGTGPVSPGPR